MQQDVTTFDVFHKIGRELLCAQLRNLDSLIHDLAPSPSEGQIIEVAPGLRAQIWMLQGIGVSLNSVLRLTDTRDMSIRDCFGIARSVAETAVNVAFLAVSDRSVIEKAIRHLRQKRWRDLSRSGRIGASIVTIKRQIDVEISDLSGLEEALAEFTSKRGGEVRDWTRETIDDRIKAIETKSAGSGALLAGAIFTIYRPSSEILHGSLYGVNYFWQGSLAEPITSTEAFDRLWISEHFVTILSTLVFASSGAIQAVATVHKHRSHNEKQKSVLALLREYAENLSSTLGD